MKPNLLINLTNNTSNMTAYFLDPETNKFQILDFVSFATDKLISNSTILDIDQLATIIQQNYQLLCQNVLVDKFHEINLVLPFQIPILNKQIFVNNKFERYEKKIDEIQFFEIKFYKFYIGAEKVHYSYFINKSLFEKYKNLFMKLRLKISEIYTPALLIPQFFAENSKFNAVIELEDRKITYNFYYGRNIFNTKSISYGVDYIFEHLAKKLKDSYDLDQSFQIDKMIELLKIDPVLDPKNNLSLLLLFNDRPLSVLEFFIATLKKAINEVLIGILYKTLNKLKNELKIPQLETICLYKNDFIYKLFQENFSKLGSKWISPDQLLAASNYQLLDIDDPIVHSFFLMQNQKLKKAEIRQTKNLTKTQSQTSSTNIL